jgi:hypothetical protein
MLVSIFSRPKNQVWLFSDVWGDNRIGVRDLARTKGRKHRRQTRRGLTRYKASRLSAYRKLGQAKPQLRGVGFVDFRLLED